MFAQLPVRLSQRVRVLPCGNTFAQVTRTSRGLVGANLEVSALNRGVMKGVVR